MTKKHILVIPAYRRNQACLAGRQGKRIIREQKIERDCRETVDCIDCIELQNQKRAPSIFPVLVLQ